jgi:hypothetical protein
MAGRIYLVTCTSTEGKPEKRLVRAANSAQAWRHVADSRISVDLASQDDLVATVGEGVKVEDANGDAS